MCNFFSAVLTKEKLHAYYGVDSHTDIMELAGIKDDKPFPDFVKIELLPDYQSFNLDFNKWNFVIDQDRVPDWFKKVSAKKKVISFLKSVPTIKNDVDIAYGQYWFCVGKVERLIGYSTILFMLGSSQVGEMWGSSQVGEMWDSSQVGEMWDSSQVGKMRGSSQVGEMLGSSQVGKMRGSSQVGKMLGSSQVGKMLDSSQVGKMLDSSQVGEMWGSSQVKTRKGK